jgi:Holliday junction resolvasome RuvABC endonuclease subunit
VNLAEMREMGVPFWLAGGYGNADKESVAKMVKYILKLPADKLDDNASDALAIAITAAYGATYQRKLDRSS